MLERSSAGIKDHSRLLNLLVDVHTQYALLVGRGASQTLNGGTGAGNLLHLAGNPVDGGTVQIDNPTKLNIQRTMGHTIGGSADTAGGTALQLKVPGGYTPTGLTRMLQIQPSFIHGANNQSLFAVSGSITSKSAGFTNGNVFGLDYAASGDGTSGGTYVDVVGIRAQFQVGSTPPTLTRLAGIVVRAPSVLSVPIASKGYGLHIEDQSNANLTQPVHSFHVDDQLLNAVGPLMWIGGTTPNLEVFSGAPSNAGLATRGDSVCYAAFNENGLLALRGFIWKTLATVGVADKVMVAV